MTLLEVREVAVRFGGLMALQGVSLDVAPGVVTGLIGPNGAGKTTLFNTITGLQPPSSGQVRFNNRDVSNFAPHKRARLGIARTFQRLELFASLTVQENIECALSMSARYRKRTESPGAATQRLLTRVGLSHVAHVLAGSLPTGQGRVVELARALATEPSVILLDEPASGQDDTDTAHFADLLREMASDGMAVLLVEHDMDLVMSVCDQIYVLDFGRILATGTADEIRTNQTVLDAYLGAGFAA